MCSIAEFQQSKSYLQHHIKFDLHTNASLFEITIRVLGGLLSAYHLSSHHYDDRILIDLAQNVANRLMSAFDSSPIPYTNIDLKTSKSNSPIANDDLMLAEVTSIQLEFRELSRITGNSIYEVVIYINQICARLYTIIVAKVISNI
jgi:mannosyl-oligosaccharide alpha-1,2-mannosidase